MAGSTLLKASALGSKPWYHTKCWGDLHPHVRADPLWNTAQLSPGPLVAPYGTDNYNSFVIIEPVQGRRLLHWWQQSDGDNVALMSIRHIPLLTVWTI